MGLFNDPNDPDGCVQKALLAGCLLAVVAFAAMIYFAVKAFA